MSQICPVCMSYMQHAGNENRYFKCPACGFTKLREVKVKFMKCITLSDAINRYGKIENGKWSEEAKWMGMFNVPKELADCMINSATGKPTTRIYCNKDMHAPLLQAFNAIIAQNLHTSVTSFDGCFQIRMVRGTTSSPSTHSYGLAIDINAKSNGLGQKPQLPEAIVKCFTDQGFSWGGNFKRLDGMHFSFAWE